MKQRTQRKRWLGIMLAICLYFVGVCGVEATENIPVYTSFSCVSTSDRPAEYEAPVRAAGSVEHTVKMPVEQLYQNSLLWVPYVIQLTERICRSHGSCWSRISRRDAAAGSMWRRSMAGHRSLSACLRQLAMAGYLQG